MTSGLVGAKLQSSFACPVWPKTEFQHRKALRRCRQLGLTSFQEVDLFKTDVTKRCGKFQTKIDIQASRKLQPSAQWKPKLSPSWAVLKRPFISQGRKELLTPHLRITYTATVSAYRWRFQYFAYAPAYADLSISGFYLRAQSYDHLPSYHMKGAL